MISNIILHIGIHKTATTTIHNTLADNREQLAANGILYLSGSLNWNPEVINAPKSM